MKTKSIAFDQAGILSIDTKTANIFSILLGSLLIAVLAQISIPVPFSPVPITGQTIGVVLLGGLLGARRGTMVKEKFKIEAWAWMLTYLMKRALP